LHVKEIEVTVRLMYGLCTQRPCCREYEIAPFVACPVRLSEFVQLHVPDISIQIPLNRPQHAWQLRSSKNSFVFGDGIQQADRFNIRPESSLGRLVTEGHRHNFRIARRRQPVSQPTLRGLCWQCCSITGPLWQPGWKFIEPVMAGNFVE